MGIQNQKIDFENRFLVIGCFGLALSIYVLLRYILGVAQYPFLLDDAYITLRYAENLALEGEFVYNLGQQVFGITTLLPPLLFSFLLKVSGPFMQPTTLVMVCNIVIECFCIVFGAVFLSKLEFSKYVSLCISLAWVSNFFFLSASQGGMETPFFCLCLLLVFLTVNKSPYQAGLFATLALFIRPEGALLLTIVFALNVFIFRKPGLYVLLVIACMAYFSFLFLFYGAVIPQSVLIKSRLYAPPFAAAKVLLESMSSFLPMGKLSLWLRLGIVYSFCGYGIYRWPRKDYAFLVLLTFPLGMFLLYTLQNPPMWFWYTVPFIFSLGAFFLYGFVKALEMFKVPTGVVCVLALFLVTLNFKAAFISDQNLLSLYTERVAGYYETVKRLQEKEGLTPQDSILTHEVGAVGFYSKAIIDDAVGLVTPELASLGVVSKKGGKYLQYGYLTEKLLVASDPDFILFQKNYIDRALLDSGYFKENYLFLFTQPHTSFNESSGDLMVFKKRGK